MAVTQDSINFQLAQLHKRRVIHPRLELSPEDTGVTIDAALGPPTIALGIPDHPRAAILSLSLPSGKLEYYVGAGPKAQLHTLPIADWRLAFRVNLDFQEIAATAVKASTVVPAEVKAHLEAFSPEKFSIRQLMLDFQNADLVELDMTRTQLPLPAGEKPTPGVLLHLQQVLKAYISSLRGAENPYVLGYAVDVRPQQPNDGPLAPTSGTFSTYADATADGMNALNFLVMTNHQALPTASTTGVFAANWVRSRTLDGRLVLARERFWESWLLAPAEDVLGKATSIDGGWTFDKSTQKVFPIKDLGRVGVIPIDVTVTNSFTYHTTAKCWNSSDTAFSVALEGTWVARRQYDAKPVGVPTMFAELATVHWTATLAVTAGANGQLAVAPWQVAIKPMEFSKDYNWAGWFELGIQSNRNLLETDATALDKQLRGMLDRLRPGLLASRIFMPTGSTMFLKSVQLDADRNVLADISFNGAA